MRASPALGVDSDELLLRRYHSNPDDEVVRDELVRRLLPLAHKVARRYASRAEPLEDLEQVAALGLIKAIDRFDPERGSAFSSFAVPTILGELKRHFRDTTWCVRPTRAVQELVVRVARTTDALAAELQRAPTAQEVAAAIGCSPEMVLEAREALRNYRPDSLDGQVPGDAAVTLGDRIGRVDEGYAFVEDALAVAPGLEALPERDRVILVLRYENDLSQMEIAKRMGISQMHVSRIIRRSLARVRVIADGRTNATGAALAA